MPEIKKELYGYCLNFALGRIEAAEQAIIAAKEASESDTKSSAGDKYETTREMMQQEISRNQAQLQEARRLKHALSLINPEKEHQTAQAGSLVITDNGNFYIAISAGQIKLNDQSYFAVSSIAPIGKVLTGLKKGDSFTFNQKQIKVLNVL